MLWVKSIIIGVIALAVIGFGTTAVLTYKKAVQENTRLRGEVATWVAQDNILRTQVTRLQAYQSATNKRVIVQRKQIAKLESLRSVRNEKGDILPASDNVLILLNGMFSSANYANQTSGYPDNATLLGGSPAPSDF